MPIYEYHCGKCGDFEVMQKMSDKPLTTCPTCRRKVNKLISSTSFQLKGSGWYVTDYARKGGAGSGKKGDKADDKPAKGDDAKTGDAKTGDSKSGDAKTGDSAAATDSKPPESAPKKAGTAKAAAA